MSLGKIILWWKGLNFLGSSLFGLLLWLKTALAQKTHSWATSILSDEIHRELQAAWNCS